MSGEVEAGAGGALEGEPKGVGAYLRPYRRQLLWGVGLLLLTNGLDKTIPWLLLHAIDGIRDGDYALVAKMATITGVMAAGMWFIRALSRVHVFNVGRDVEYDLRNELIESVHRLGPGFLGRTGTGEIMSRATSDLGQVRLLVGFGVLNVVNSVFAYAGGVLLMLLISPTLTLYALAPYPLFFLIARIFSKRLYVRSREAQEALGRLADRVQENVAGVRLIRSLGVEAHERQRFDRANQGAIDANMKLVMLRGLMWPVLTGIGSLAALVAVWVGGGMVLRDEISPGELAAFLAYLGQLVWPTLALGYLLSVVQRGRASYGRIREILDAEPEIRELPEPLEAGAGGALRVEGLDFDRGDQRVLDDVSFEVPAGDSLAIVGPIGAGKSTLAALLPRLLATPEGCVHLDDVDITRIGLTQLRSKIGYAPQEPFLFSTSVARNIAFALDDPEAGDASERIAHAAAEAAVLEEILELPEGFETQVGERGVQLSGGQKQRIALARALLREPAILVLDDPLSAVDARTEAQILAALDRVGEGRTLILITHRVAAASKADRVAVLDGGRIVERGTHEELLEAGGIYARMASRQRMERELLER